MDRPAGGYERADIEALLGVGKGVSRRRRLLRHALQLGIVAALLLGAYLLLRDRSGDKPVYVTEPVALGDLTVVVTAVGTVEPTRKVDVSSELSGIVRKVHVDFNSVVREGDVLAELDTDKLAATVASSRARLVAAEAEVAQARATVEEARLALERRRSLAAREAVSQQDLDAAKAAYERAVAGLASAEANVGVARAQLRLDETNLAKAKILSPINGVILARHVDPGQTVAASFQAPVLFTIAEDLREMEVQVDVDEADVGMVREGQSAVFSVDAYPQRDFEASIRQLRFGSEIVQGVVTYKAILTTDNAELLLRPGMTATAEITVEEIKDALTVPNAALRFSPAAEEPAGTDGGLLRALLPRHPQFRAASPQETESGRRTVWVLRDGVPTAVPVVTGATDGRRTAIVEGALTVGQAVIVDSTTGG